MGKQQKLVALEQLGLLTDDSTNQPVDTSLIKNWFHDWTAVSNGVLADPTGGGGRRDLSDETSADGRAVCGVARLRIAPRGCAFTYGSASGSGVLFGCIA